MSVEVNIPIYNRNRCTRGKVWVSVVDVGVVDVKRRFRIASPVYPVSTHQCTQLLVISPTPINKHEPFERISHFDVLRVLSTGRESRNSSNRSFISLRRFRSASLWLTRNSGER